MCVSVLVIREYEYTGPTWLDNNDVDDALAFELHLIRMADADPALD
jgi:hypothetical protein